ncbi:MAG: signal transduction histidine kinase, partial [Alphaproteobacteria bacterium]|nr:signal transduction histidine kinase [Alphaproteobacteria bacterium]
EAVLATRHEETSRPAPDLDDFFENGTVGLHLVAGDGTILKANPADYAPLGYTAEEYVGRKITDFHADADVIADILARLTRGEKLDKYPARLKAKDGSIRHVQISSSVCFREGAFVNTRCFTVDVTDKKAAEEALREAKERLAATYESAVAGIAEVDAEGRFLSVNEAFCRMTGYEKDELGQLGFFDLTHPDDVPGEREHYAQIVRGQTDRFIIEKRYVRKDGRIIWVQVMNSAVRRADGTFAFGVKMFQDITGRKEGEARQKLLLDELNHRVKNTLATVQSIAAQTARNCSSAEEFRARFEPRLLALSAAHDRLTRNQWEGASLRDIAEEELAAHAAPGRRLRAEGPDLHLPPRASLSLSMALHELATNAAKHGALSEPGGEVALSWTIERQGSPFPTGVRLLWVEKGGRDVTPPATEGFGSRLLRVTARELDGEMDMDFAPEGLRWRLTFPLAHPTAAAA